MEKNIETEYKMMLDRSIFDRILSDHKGHKVYTQTNYYLTSKELSDKLYSLRLREKEGYYEMTLKKPTETMAKIEMNLELSKEEFERIKNEEYIDNDIFRLLKSEGFHIDTIKQAYSLKTIRHDIPLQYGLLSLDENYYNSCHDYELEFELSDLVHGPEEFKQLLNTYQLTYITNCLSKIKRVLNSL